MALDLELDTLAQKHQAPAASYAYQMIVLNLFVDFQGRIQSPYLLRDGT